VIVNQRSRFQRGLARCYPSYASIATVLHGRAPSLQGDSETPRVPAGAFRVFDLPPDRVSDHKDQDEQQAQAPQSPPGGPPPFLTRERAAGRRTRDDSGGVETRLRAPAACDVTFIEWLEGGATLLLSNAIVLHLDDLRHRKVTAKRPGFRPGRFSFALPPDRVPDHDDQDDQEREQCDRLHLMDHLLSRLGNELPAAGPETIQVVSKHDRVCPVDATGTRVTQQDTGVPNARRNRADPRDGSRGVSLRPPGAYEPACEPSRGRGTRRRTRSCC